MKLMQFEEALEKDDFSVGDSFWISDWEFEVVNRRRGGKPAEDEVVFKWELTRQKVVQVIADHYPEIQDPDGFFARHKEDIMHRFREGLPILVGECGFDYEIPLLGAIDEVVEQKPEACPRGARTGSRETAGGEGDKGAGTQEAKRKRIVTIAGEPIVDIYESENGRCWYVTKRTQKQGQGFVSGYVRCLRTPMLAEFQQLAEEVLHDTAQRMWRVEEDAWGRCPCVDLEEDGTRPTIVRWDGEEESSRPSRSCSNHGKEVITK